MNLDLFNDLFKSTKENNVIQSFIKELGKALENNLVNNEINEVSLVEKILNGRTLTARYRDEINIQRHDIIKDYSRESMEQGEFYYVHNKRSDNTYGLVSYKNGESGISIGIKKSQLPKGSGLDCILRKENGKFVLDKEKTKKLQIKLTEMINRLLEEQANRLESQRIEGHNYEVVEKTGNIVELIDETLDNGECFEEINISKELLDKVNQGTKLKYENGIYKLN